MLLSKNQEEEILAATENHQPFVIPTETVYGLAAIASDSEAVDRVYKIKSRPKDNPLICHFYSVEQILEYVDATKIPAYFYELAAKFSPGPITYFLPIKSDSPLKPALGDRAKIGCRIPNHPLALEILKLVKSPLAAPSANTSGKYSGTNYQMVKADLGGKVEVFIDGGQSVIGLESTTIDCINQDEITIYRPGFISKQDLESVLQSSGFEHVSVSYVSRQAQLEATPGLKYEHYKPKAQVRQLTSLPNFTSLSLKNGYFIISNQQPGISNLQLNIKQIPLNLEEIASGLYSSLFELDQQNPETICIYIDPEIKFLTNHPLYKAVSDRLQKICGKSIFN